MPVRIEYIPGQIVGDYGTIFIKDIDHLVTPGGHIVRKAHFVCSFCGSGFDSVIGGIRSGHAISCGCHYLVAIRRGNTTHGLWRHPLYKMWHGIISRCYDIESRGYDNYGARGIEMYQPWVRSFKKFINYVTILPDYAVNNLGCGGISLDRIDNDGNYEPGNLRWADSHLQAVNQRMNPRNTSGYTGVNWSKLGWG